MTHADQIHASPSIEQGEKLNESTMRTSTHLADDINSEETFKKEGSDVQPAKPPQSLPQSKSAEIAIPGDEEDPESDRARIERLGRERPAKFKSFGAELAFCYSVIASQFMSVRSVPATAVTRV